jgi:hypothetical protein
MTPSLGASVSAALAAADPALLAPSELLRLHRFTDRLPPSFTSFGFECRLSQPRRPVDFGLALPRRFDQIEALRRALGPDESAFWTALLGYARRWCDSPAPTADAIFLEFDAGDDGFRKEPIAFVRVDGRRERTREVAEEALAHFAAAPPPLWLLLPADLHFTDVACLAPRAPGGVRVGLALPTARLVSLLDTIQWPGPILETYHLIQSLCPSGMVRLQLDLKEDPKLGFEIVRNPAPLATAEWKSLLDALVGRGLCSAEESEALLRWPGSSRHRLDDTSWPMSLCRQLSHLKISVDVQGRMGAKAYLAVTPVFALFD